MSTLRWFDAEGVFIRRVRNMQWMRIVTNLLDIERFNEIGIGAARRRQAVRGDGRRRTMTLMIQLIQQRQRIETISGLLEEKERLDARRFSLHTLLRSDSSMETIRVVYRTGLATSRRSSSAER